MGRNKELRKKIAGQERVIADHMAKIRREHAKPHPDDDVVRGWEREIEAARKKLENLTRRLEREW